MWGCIISLANASMGGWKLSTCAEWRNKEWTSLEMAWLTLARLHGKGLMRRTSEMCLVWAGYGGMRRADGGRMMLPTRCCDGKIGSAKDGHFDGGTTGFWGSLHGASKQKKTAKTSPKTTDENSKMREILHLQVGQGGNRIGAKVSDFQISVNDKTEFNLLTPVYTGL